jgi:hypothetical protein
MLDLCAVTLTRCPILLQGGTSGEGAAAADEAEAEDLPAYQFRMGLGNTTMQTKCTLVLLIVICNCGQPACCSRRCPALLADCLHIAEDIPAYVMQHPLGGVATCCGCWAASARAQPRCMWLAHLDATACFRKQVPL